jgi:2-polyprenyl-6-methoxyphenol hydroxylase-like FAD-dependent oxidoreductase
MVSSGTMFLDATREQDGYMHVRLGGPSEPKEGRIVHTRFLVGADGTHSVVAQRLELERNTHFLAGAEWLVENVPLDRETFYLVMDHQIAPGYCLWLAPHGDIAALERRSSNEVDRKSEAWLAQENPSDKEKEHATSALATCSGVVRARRTDRETDSESQIIRVSAKAAARTPG